MEHNIGLEPKHHEDSDQLCELTSLSIAVGILVEFKRMEVSPVHPPATESKHQLDLLDSLIECGEINSLYPWNLSESETVFESSSSVLLSPPSLPLPPPLLTQGHSVFWGRFVPLFISRPLPSLSSSSPISPCHNILLSVVRLHLPRLCRRLSSPCHWAFALQSSGSLPPGHSYSHHHNGCYLLLSRPGRRPLSVCLPLVPAHCHVLLPSHLYLPFMA